MFIVRYCIEEKYRKGRELVVVAIDFEKVFDSVGRITLVKALKFYRCDTRMMDVMVDIFTGDRTKIWRDGEVLGETEVTIYRSYIDRDIYIYRQGCMESQQLFVMLVNVIMNCILDSGMG